MARIKQLDRAMREVRREMAALDTFDNQYLESTKDGPLDMAHYNACLWVWRANCEASKSNRSV